MSIRPVNAIGAIAALVVISATHAAWADRYSDPEGQIFRREMLPKIGQKITFVGIVVPGKFGVRITPDHWVGIEIEARGTNQTDLATLNRVDQLQGHRLSVQGILHLQPERKSKNPMAAAVTEHFYFDIKEVSYSEIDKDGGNNDAKPNKPHAVDPR